MEVNTILYANEKEKGKDEFHISCEISELKYHEKTYLMLYCIM